MECENHFRNKEIYNYRANSVFSEYLVLLKAQDSPVET